MTEPVVRVRNLTKIFRGYRREEGLAAALKSLVRRVPTEVAAVSDVTFSIDPGEMVGYIGANGAGKSTTIKMLTGILTPSSGEIVCNGFVPARDRTRYVATIGVVFGQRTQLWWDIAVVESFRLLKEIYGLSDADYRERMEIFDKILGLKAYLHQPVRKLSLGERMRCDLAASLLHRPPLLFLDEPTIGLDVVAKASVREFLQQINRREDTTVLLTTHDLSDIETLCRRVVVIDHGRLLFDGPLARLRDRILPMTSVVFDVKTQPEAEKLSWDGLEVREVASHRYRLDIDRRSTSPAAAVKEIMNRFDVADIAIEEPQIEDVVKRIYVEGLGKDEGLRKEPSDD
jgi:ABC-2 type transport system ATP-binding protein